MYGGITLCAGTFQSTSTSAMVSDSPLVRQHQLNGPTTPTRQRLPAIAPHRFSLFRFRSPLLTESLLFSLPVGTEMFHFPTFPPIALCVQATVTGHDSSWVSPFGHPRITARLSTSRGLSQTPTSFIGSWCQGIHHALLVACHQQKFATKMLASTMQFSRYGRYLTGSPRARVSGSFGEGQIHEGRAESDVLRRSILQDPTVCLTPPSSRSCVPLQRTGCTCLTSTVS